MSSRRRRKPRKYDYKHVGAMLAPAVKRDLDDVLATAGLGFTDWLRAMIVRCKAERLPESQGAVKKIIPMEVAELAQKVLFAEGERIHSSAGKLADPSSRNRRREEADPYFQASDWFADVVEQINVRQHILESGQRQPRHRYTARDSDRDEDQDSK